MNQYGETKGHRKLEKVGEWRAFDRPSGKIVEFYIKPKDIKKAETRIDRGYELVHSSQDPGGVYLCYVKGDPSVVWFE